MAEGRRPVEGKVSSNACSGRSAGLSMSQKQRACGSWRPNPRSRLTFDESPLRESCTVGSMGEVPGNWHLYPTSGVILYGDPETPTRFSRVWWYFVDLDRENQNARRAAVSNARHRTHDQHRCCIVSAATKLGRTNCRS